MRSFSSAVRALLRGARITALVNATAKGYGAKAEISWCGLPFAETDSAAIALAGKVASELVGSRVDLSSRA